jgi:outer membrane protein
VAQSRGNLEAARMTLASTQAQVTASTAALDGVSEGQRGGERSILDVLNATQELVEAQVASAVAARNNVVAAYQVLEALGQLSVVKLNLPVTRYDPEISYQRARDAWIDTGD